MAFSRLSILCDILMDRMSWSAYFMCGLDLVYSSTGKSLVLCRKRSNRDPVCLCGETEMGHNAMLSSRMFLIM